MADVCSTRKSVWLLLRFLVVTLLVGLPSTTKGLSTSYYAQSCPNLESVAKAALDSQLQSDGRVGASLLRAHFHDCFVQGCDASVLLDDTANFTGEKSAGPNANSLRGFSAIDAIKSAVESSCQGVVSCADILALAARDAVVAAQGPSWPVEFGRLDSVTASQQGANNNLASPDSNLQTLVTSFTNQGLSQLDFVALSGAHTIGKVQCGNINSRLYNWQGTGAPDPTLDSKYLGTLQGECPSGGAFSTTVDLDQSTGTNFDNNYYTNLLSNKGTLFSDQTMETQNGSTATTVSGFANNQIQFFAQFANSIVKMGRLAPPSGSTGQVRLNCRKLN